MTWPSALLYSFIDRLAKLDVLIAVLAILAACVALAIFLGITRSRGSPEVIRVRGSVHPVVDWLDRPASGRRNGDLAGPLLRDLPEGDPAAERARLRGRGTSLIASLHFGANQCARAASRWV